MGGFGGGGNSGRETGITNQYKGPKGTTKREKTTTEKISDGIKNVVSNMPSVKVITAIGKALDPKTNKKGKTGDVYGGKTSYGYNEAKEKIDYNPTSTLANRGGNDRPSQKSIEQPKVAAQMDNSAVKSDLVNADVTSPTYVEMNQEEDLLARKKRGRKQTILTPVTGDTTKPQLSKKTLLG